jgi:hypothetical protein
LSIALMCFLLGATFRGPAFSRKMPFANLNITTSFRSQGSTV